VNDEHTACIADFGLARILGESGFTTKSVSGTWRWMAFELIEFSDEEESIPPVTFESDVWAFGMTVLEVRQVFSVTALNLIMLFF
jgi:serine/threonine protein kinase